MINIVQTALQYYESGMTPLPAIATPEEKRPTLPSYKEYQTQRPTPSQINRWFAQAEGICLLCGKASGNLELIDFDFEAMLFDAWCAAVPAELLSRVVIETSINVGKHVVYQCQSPIDGNTHLARRKIQFESADQQIIARKKVVPRKNKDGSFSAIITLIETRGEGGLFLCSPTPGYTITQGDLANPPIITAAERNLLLDAARALNECENSQRSDSSSVSSSGDSTIPTSRPFEPQAATSGILPGDDYIARGDVTALLAKHGWRNVGSKPDGNTLWRRPGKESGHSASLKDSIFFVFSSNASPLDADRAYNPFQLYAALEHEDNYKAAAAALRAEGFGRDADNSDVDISGILSSVSEPSEPPTSSPADPGPMPDELLHIPGFIKQVMDFTLNTAPYPNTVLAFAGALALLSFLSGRKVRDESDLRTNLYLLALANSGAGKDHPRKVNQSILVDAGIPESIADGFASGEGIEDRMQAIQSMLFQTDEIDGLIRSIDRSKDARHETIMNVLLKLYTSSAGFYPMRVKAGAKCSVIDQPSLTLLGTAVPKFFYEALTARMLNNGFFARLIVLEADKRGTGRTARLLQIPDEIKSIAKWWVDYRPGRRGNLSDWHPEPEVIPVITEAKQRLGAIQAEADERYTKAEENDDPSGMAIWARAYEKVRKLALIYAVSAQHLSPSIDTNAVNWAWDFVDYQTKRMLFMADQHVAESDFEDMCNKLIEALRKWKSKHGDDWADHRWLGQRIRGWKPQEWEAVRESLADREIIEFATVPSERRPKIIYRFKGDSR